MQSPTPPRRRWLRFSLRTLLVVIAVLAVPLAWVAKERLQSSYEHRVAELLLQQGYDYADLRGPLDVLSLAPNYVPATWWQKLAGQLLGTRIIAVGTSELPIADLTPLVGLTNLQKVYHRGSLIVDLTPLAKVKSLRDLALTDSPVKDISPLAGLKNLEELWIDNTLVTDLSPLAHLPKLRVVNVWGNLPGPTTVTKEEAEKLQKYLPDCQINYFPFR